MTYYPFLFEPIYKEMPWGASNLNDLYRKNSPFEKTGEAWVLTCRKDEMGIIANGFLSGVRFADVIENDRAGVLGEAFCEFTDFPLLIKLIDANAFLSVQVHPDDSYAQERENYPYGKNEVWYCLSAEEGSFIYLGLKKSVSREQFENAIKDGTCAEYLNKVLIKEGDIINIPAGLLHAIGYGIIVTEIQQNSDITYRVYDYDRKGLDGKKRELHIDKALDVIDFSHKHHVAPVLPRLIHESAGLNTYICIKNAYFIIYLMQINGGIEQNSDKTHFDALTCVHGKLVIKTDASEVHLEKGDCVFIPASLGAYRISGVGTLLRTVPNISPR